MKNVKKKYIFKFPVYKFFFFVFITTDGMLVLERI